MSTTYKIVDVSAPDYLILHTGYVERLMKWLPEFLGLVQKQINYDENDKSVELLSVINYHKKVLYRYKGAIPSEITPLIDENFSGLIFKIDAIYRLHGIVEQLEKMDYCYGLDLGNLHKMRYISKDDFHCIYCDLDTESG